MMSVPGIVLLLCFTNAFSEVVLLPKVTPEMPPLKITQGLAVFNITVYKMTTDDVILIPLLLEDQCREKLLHEAQIGNPRVAIPAVVNVTSFESWLLWQNISDTQPELRNESTRTPLKANVEIESATDLSGYTVVTVSVHARRLGKTNLTISSLCTTGNATLLSQNAVSLEVIVIRPVRLRDTLCINVIIVLVVLLNLCFGCNLDLSIVVGYIKKPVAPLIGFCCQFLCMPLIGLAVLQAVELDPIYGFGLLILSCSPGGGASNSWTLLLGGDVNLSLTMTFCSLVFSLGMMPLWLLIMSRIYFDASDLRVPYLRMFLILLQFVIPCFGGILLRRFREGFARRVGRAGKPLCVILLLWVTGFGLYVSLYMFDLMADYPNIALATILLSYVGFGVGFLIAKLCRQPRMRAVTIAIETGIQNVAISIIMLRQKFAQPEGDMAATISMISRLFYPIPLFIALIVLVIRRRWCPEGEKHPLPSSDVAKMREDVSADQEGAGKPALSMEDMGSLSL